MSARATAREAVGEPEAAASFCTVECNSAMLGGFGSAENGPADPPSATTTGVAGRSASSNRRANTGAEGRPQGDGAVLRKYCPASDPNESREDTTAGSVRKMGSAAAPLNASDPANCPDPLLEMAGAGSALSPMITASRSGALAAPERPPRRDMAAVLGRDPEPGPRVGDGTAAATARMELPACRPRYSFGGDGIVARAGHLG
ncbi:hypothetical protein DFJ74DRAFT_684386 [Hyaloraphidium curvatum]|nr:hypothetical protein DFJ74DRAFT_684386 [Hyaloraphidium curvatum]